MKGRKPKPPENTVPVQCDTPLGAAPTHLCAKAKTLYRKLAVELGGILSSLDTTTLAAYCQCWARWVEVEETISKDGVSTGGKAHPLLRTADCLLRQLKQFGEVLGLSPLARGRIAGPVVSSDELDKFLNV